MIVPCFYHTTIIVKANDQIFAASIRRNITIGMMDKSMDTHTSYNNQRELKVKGNLPLIFVAGVQKGGSSSLHELLIKHPLLCGGQHKESHYFDDINAHNKGVEFYKQQFNDPKCDGKSKARFVDSTPIFHINEVWERIKNTYPAALRDQLKFIVLLREPVSRDVSWYQQYVRTELYDHGRKFNEMKTMKEMHEILTSKMHGRHNDTRLKGKYIEQLQSLTKHFRRNQIMVISSVAIFKDTTKMMELIRQFIDVPADDCFELPFPHDDHLGKFEKEGVTECITDHIPKLDCAYRDYMGSFYAPYNEKLYQWLEETRADGDPNEPEFSPRFDSYKLVKCEEDARSDYDNLLAHDKLPKGFPEGACHEAVHKTTFHGVDVRTGDDQQ